MEDACLQVVILDSSPNYDGNRSEILFEEAAIASLLFGRCHMLMNSKNTFYLFANHQNSSRIVYPLQDNRTLNNEDILKSLIEIYNEPCDISRNGKGLTQSLSLALCVINRILIENSNIETKILVIQKGEDNTSEYNSFMNCIFSAQKCAIPVDAVVLNAKQSSFMQQACYLTEGIYLRPDYQSDILQLLITHCLPNITSRKLLKAPLMQSVDFKAACFCHGQQVEFAYMCIVCLSLWCSYLDICPTCGMKTRDQRKIST